MAACAKPSRTGHAAEPGPGDVVLFFTTELQGTIEPCGCTSDPLGDLARTAQVIASEKRPAALFDGGSTLFLLRAPSDQDRVQERLKAELIVSTLPKIGLRAAGLGPLDLVDGNDKVAPPRQAANVPAGAGVPLEAPKLVQVGGVSVGVFGVVDPALVPSLKATDPAAAARQAIAELKKKGAQVIVALAHMPLRAARKLAQDAPGADFVLVGAEPPPFGEWTPETVGRSTLVLPGNQGQVLARVELHVAPEGGPFVDAIGPERAAAESAELDAKIARLEAELARWADDPTAEQSFVDGKRDELSKMKADRQALAEKPLRTPASGSWFAFRLVPIKKGLACDPALVAAKQELDRKIGEANLAHATPVAPAAAGQPGYVGVEECVHCHKAQVDHWRTTRHANAWATLTRVGKQTDRYCVSCHVTGWEQPGGSALAAVIKDPLLREVQCETCHGPASLHVDADGKRVDSLTKVDLGLCATRCHTPEHSDTFQVDAYLRDVLGPGHAAERWKKLGDGPRGHELRAAALAKAGSALGEHCPK